MSRFECMSMTCEFKENCRKQSLVVRNPVLLYSVKKETPPLKSIVCESHSILLLFVLDSLRQNMVQPNLQIWP